MNHCSRHRVILCNAALGDKHLKLVTYHMLPRCSLLSWDFTKLSKWCKFGKTKRRNRVYPLTQLDWLQRVVLHDMFFVQNITTNMSWSSLLDQLIPQDSTRLDSAWWLLFMTSLLDSWFFTWQQTAFKADLRPNLMLRLFSTIAKYQPCHQHVVWVKKNMWNVKQLSKHVWTQENILEPVHERTKQTKHTWTWPWLKMGHLSTYEAVATRTASSSIRFASALSSSWPDSLALGFH